MKHLWSYAMFVILWNIRDLMLKPCHYMQQKTKKFTRVPLNLFTEKSFRSNDWFPSISFCDHAQAILSVLLSRASKDDSFALYFVITRKPYFWALLYRAFKMDDLLTLALAFHAQAFPVHLPSLCGFCTDLTASLGAAKERCGVTQHSHSIHWFVQVQKFFMQTWRPVLDPPKKNWR